MVGGLTHQRMNEIRSTESSCNNRVNSSTVGRMDLDVFTDMRKDVLVSERDEDEFTKVTVCGIILTVVSAENQRDNLQSVKGSTEKLESLVLGS